MKNPYNQMPLLNKLAITILGLAFVVAIIMDYIG